MTRPATPATVANRRRPVAVSDSRQQADYVSETLPASHPLPPVANWQRTGTQPPSTDRAALSAWLLAEANAAMRCRRALLCARVALSTTTTFAAARASLARWEAEDSVRGDAIAILDTLDTTLDGTL